MLALYLGGVARDLVAHLQRRVACPLRMILVRDRRAEQGHDAGARELVDEAFEAFDVVGEDSRSVNVAFEGSSLSRMFFSGDEAVDGAPHDVSSPWRR